MCQCDGEVDSCSGIPAAESIWKAAALPCGRAWERSTVTPSHISGSLSPSFPPPDLPSASSAPQAVNGGVLYVFLCMVKRRPCCEVIAVGGVPLPFAQLWCISGVVGEGRQVCVLM